MRVVSLTLARRTTSTTSLPSGIVADLFWALMSPADRVEHIHVRSWPTRIDLTLFLLTGTEQGAEAAARRLAVRVLATAPLLSQWRLVL